MPRVRLLGVVRHDGTTYAAGSVESFDEGVVGNWPAGTCEVLAEPVEPTEPALDDAGLKLGGPTLEEYVAAGYKAEGYPPQGWAIVPSPGYSAYIEEALKDTVPATDHDPPKPPAA